MHQQTPAKNAPDAPALVAITTPAEARVHADELINAMSGLLEVVERETELVRAGNVRDASALAASKTEASSRYVRSVSTLRNNAGYLKQATPELLTAIHRHHDVFRSMLQVNLTVLATAHAVTEGIVRGVNGEIQRQRMPAGYTAAGRRAMPAPRQASPLSYSRSF